MVLHPGCKAPWLLRPGCKAPRLLHPGLQGAGAPVATTATQTGQASRSAHQEHQG